MSRYSSALLLAVLVLVATACDVRVATEIVVEDDYSGRLIVSIALDDETASDLVAAGLVPDAGLQDALASAPGWQVEQIDDLRASARLTRPFDHVDEVGPLLADLASELGPEDGQLWDGLRLRVDADGNVVVEGRAGLVPPTVAGAVGSNITFDGEDLARLLAEQGRDAIRHDLRVTSAGLPGRNDADLALDNALVWELPVGEMRSVNAVLPVEPSPDLPRTIALGLLAAAGTAVVTMLTRRRTAA